MIQATTALRKISRLRKKIWGIQGGQGAGKTIGILILLINHAGTIPNREIYIASSELSKMRDTVIKDFVKIINECGIKCRLTGIQYGAPRCDFPNGSFIRFLGLDVDDVGKGLRSDIVFVNEANKVTFEKYRELTSRAGRVIIDFNPNKKFWFHNEVKTRDDCDYLCLTFLDNEYLSEAERNEILRYKSKGYAADGVTIVNQYWANMWRVYGLGEIGQVEGRIYNWNKIPYSEYLKINKQEYYYSDWGKVDPWAIGSMKYNDGSLYVDELNYESENEIERRLSPQELKAIKSGDNNEHEGLVGWKFNHLYIPKTASIICDTNRPNKIRSLRRAGWEYAIGVGGKLDLENRVSILSDINIYYTDRSANIEMEQENYCYAKDKNGVQLEVPIDKDNHHIDGITYGVQHLFNLGIINRL